MAGPLNPAERAAGWKALAKRGSDSSGIVIEGGEDVQLSESSLEKVIRLTRVVVPRHNRVNPKSGKVEDVDTYTYNRKSAIGHGINAKAGSFRGGLPPSTDTHSRDMEYRTGSRKSPIRQAVENGKDLGDRIVKAPAKGRPNGTGTIDDPIDVQGDLDKAVRLLSQGKHIRLNKPDEVSVLADKMTAYVAEVRGKGGKTPDMNLCQVTIPGTNLFCHDNKGIPRIKMPQLGGEPRPGSPAYPKRDSNGRVDITEEFKQSLRDRGIKMTEKRVPALHLKATQSELDGAKVAGLANALRAGKVTEGAIFVSKDNYVIDGHHRWAAYVVNDSADNAFGDMTMPVVQVDMEIGQILDYTNWFADQQGIKPQSMDDRSSAAGKTAVKLSAASPVTDYWTEVYGWNPCCSPSSDEWRLAQLTESESSLNRVVRLTQAVVESDESDQRSALQRVELAMKTVVVPRHKRRNPITGKIEDVETYTYRRRSSVGGGLQAKTAVSGTYMAPSLRPSLESVDALAKELNDRAVAAEAEVSDTMANLVHSSSGDLTGLEFRVKTKESLVRKIKSRVKEGMTALKAAESISDALRYTATWEPSEFSHGAQTTIDQLRAGGYNVRVKNYWAELGANNPYRGINLALISPNGGLKVELQLHTPATFEKKNGRMHHLYEEFRTTEDRAEQDRLWQDMWDEMSSAETPPGAAAVH